MKLFVISIIALSITTADGQFLKRTFRLNQADSTQPQPSSNAVSQILISNGRVLLGSGDGLNISTDGGRSFETDFGKNGPTGVSLYAIAAKGDTIVTAVGTSATIDGEDHNVGQGLFASTDGGTTWTKEPQSIDSTYDSTVTFGKDTLKATPVTVTVDNVTYSLVFHKGYVYSANFAGALRRSNDLGKTWQRVVLPPDYLDYITQDSSNYTFQLSPVSGRITSENNYNHRVFSLYADGDSVLYVGTADGINKSTDNGYSWRKFTHDNTLNGISGNFVVFINGQNFGTIHNIWGATVLANGASERSGLSYTTDNGATWSNLLDGHFFHGMAFQDSIVYGASDDGLFRTSDLGQTSIATTNVFDQITRQSILSQAFYTVATNRDSVWIGTGDGSAVGVDNGTGVDPSTWHVFKAAPVVQGNTTFFYPNPFSPRLMIGRIHYPLPKNQQSQVTIRIYDFSMHIVRTLLQNAARSSALNGVSEDQWDGASDRGGLVDNGVYFYSVVVNGGSPSWGKILVIR